jgi:hypothetical protein
MKKLSTTFLSFCLLAGTSFAQMHGSTAEEKLANDTTLSKTTIGGYGNAFFQRDNNEERSTLNLERFVLFAGHKFNKQWTFFSELEVEDAKVAGGEEGGEVALEQCFVQYNKDASHNWKFGLFIPQIGILNQNHLPENYNGNERNLVESLVIPSTWRELGVSYNGTCSKIPLSYSIALMNGLNSSGFEHGSGIRGGRAEGREATGNNMAVTGALEYSFKKLKMQISGYYGGSVGLSGREADSLQLESGLFGSGVGLLEADLRYTYKKFSLKVLAATISIPKAASINRAYANNTPSLIYGGYVEAAYSLYTSKEANGKANLKAFARYEKLDLNAEIPANGIDDQTLNQQQIVVGLTYLPIANIVFKADVRISNTGDENPDLVVNASPTAPVYKKNNSFINLGFGYSF